LHFSFSEVLNHLEINPAYPYPMMLYVSVHQFDSNRYDTIEERDQVRQFESICQRHHLSEKGQDEFIKFFKQVDFAHFPQSSYQLKQKQGRIDNLVC
jgi:hypothetical protein